jgi:uncharacterized phiE125 gp8 family phage protein
MSYGIIRLREGASEPTSVRRITAPSTQAVSAGEVWAFMRLSDASLEETALLASMIKSAESYAENYTKSAICRQQWQVRLDGFDGHDGEILLPRPPLSTSSSDVAVTYVASTAGAQTLSSTAYEIDYYARPALIYPAYDNEWPETLDRRNAVSVTYWCGYSTPAAVPDAIKSWIKVRVAAMYENREGIVVGSGNYLTELPHSYVDGLLDEFVVG